MSRQTIEIIGALALAAALAGPASAASVVDVTYDLADTIVLGNWINPNLCDSTGECPANVLGGSMTIRYTSNSASSMPIVHGPATLQSLTLQANVRVGGTNNTFDLGFISITSGNLNISVLSPVVGSLLSGGTLTFASAQIHADGSRHCKAGNYLNYSGFCIALIGAVTSFNLPLGPYTTHATVTLAASAGPHGGAQSTRHTVSGTIPVYAPTRWNGLFLTPAYFATGLNILGREVLRQAEGHPDKVTPEPGTLLLLGAGTAGLAFVGRATRRARR